MSRFSVFVAWLGIAAGIAVPPQGVGFSICWFRFVTHLPCPGCGLVRSMSAVLRGDPALAISLHPLGPVVLGLFLAIAIVGILPQGMQGPILAWLKARAVKIRVIYIAGVVILVVFGFARMALTAWDRWPIPAM